MYVRIIRSDARAREKPCLRCGRSLRKNLDDRHCPQCGLSTWLSLNPNDSLDWSNPTWLRHMASGAWILAAAQMIAWVAFVIVIAAAWTAPMPVYDIGPYEDLPPEAIEDVEYLSPSAPPAPSWLMAVGVACGGVALIAWGLGLVLLARHEQRYPDRMKVSRIGAQVASAAAIALGVGLILRAMPRLGTGWPIHDPAFAIENGAWKLAVEIVVAALAVCQWAWLRRLAQRAGHWRLARVCGYLLFLPIIPLLKIVPIFSFLAVMYLWALLVYLPIVYLPASAACLVWFALLLRRTSRTAEAQWASETRLAPAPPVAEGGASRAQQLADR